MLSEEEMRLLEQMERALAEEDPKFVHTLQGRTLERTARTRAIASVAVFLIGMATLLAGAVQQLIWLGVVGFLVMLASATIGLTAWRGRHAPATPDDAGALDPHGFEADFERDFRGHDRGFRVIDGGKRGAHPRQKKAKAARHGSFMQRLEQRWQHRRDSGY